jgi:ribosomal small subunit protein bTHX
MGKGDKRTRRGKIFKGSFGNTRPHKVKTKAAPVKATAVVNKDVKTKKKAAEATTETKIAKRAPAKKSTAAKKKSESTE